MNDTAKVLLGKAEIKSAELMRAKLQKQGIAVALVHNEVSCGKGCAVQVEVWAHPDDLPAISQIMQAERNQTFAEMGYDASLAEHVFDREAASAVCPACGTNFATTHSECPECGLCFEAPEALAAAKCGPKKTC